MLLQSEGIDGLLKKSTVFLDTNTFLIAQENEEFLEFLYTKNNDDTALVTVNSVVYEYTRGSVTVDELQERRDFVNGIVETIKPINKVIESDKNDVFSLVMSLVTRSQNSQYTDYILASMLNMFRGTPESCYVLTSDTKAFSRDIFNVVGSITLDRRDKSLNHQCLIELDESKYRSLIKDAMSSK